MGKNSFFGRKIFFTRFYVCMRKWTHASCKYIFLSSISTTHLSVWKHVLQIACYEVASFTNSFFLNKIFLVNFPQILKWSGAPIRCQNYQKKDLGARLASSFPVLILTKVGHVYFLTPLKLVCKWVPFLVLRKLFKKSICDARAWKIRRTQFFTCTLDTYLCFLSHLPAKMWFLKECIVCGLRKCRWKWLKRPLPEIGMRLV